MGGKETVFLIDAQFTEEAHAVQAFLTHPLLDELREYYHPNYLSQIFKQEVVLTLQDYISHVRIAATKTQLIQAISVSCMCSALVASSLNSQFAQVITPNE